MVDISERSLEQTIEATLLAGGPDAYPGGEGLAVEPLDRYENATGDTGGEDLRITTKSFVSTRKWLLILSSPRSRKSGSG
jgi:hypothetical protein